MIKEKEHMEAILDISPNCIHTYHESQYFHYMQCLLEEKHVTLRRCSSALRFNELINMKPVKCNDVTVVNDGTLLTLDNNTFYREDSSNQSSSSQDQFDNTIYLEITEETPANTIDEDIIHASSNKNGVILKRFCKYAKNIFNK